jgi:undecaprenyl diphosphate synthase
MNYTAKNTGTVLSVALNYGGRAEIVEAAKKAAKSLIDNGDSVENLREEDIERNLYTRNLPEVDLLIRTSGEFRISNFLLWQLAYSEIYVTPTLFPTFAARIFLKRSSNIKNANGVSAESQRNDKGQFSFYSRFLLSFILL